MKMMTVFGTRPEIIRLSQVIKQLDRFCDQVLVHTGQNYDENLKDIFFEDLDVRPPDLYLAVEAPDLATRVGQIIARSGRALRQEQPDRVLILGDTDSGLAAVMAARMGIPVFHMEAGNRCYDDRVPEEINRRIIDHCSTVLMPYTHRSKENLVREGFERERIYVIGNPIHEVLNAHAVQIKASDVLHRLGVQPDEFFLTTLHRAENVDDPVRLERLLQGLIQVVDTYQQPMIVSLHPRTADKMDQFGLRPHHELLRLLQPMGLFDFVKLECTARCVLSDSGTVQEECCIFQVPSVIVRDTTERAETVECGSTILSGSDTETLMRAVAIALNSTCDWAPPAGHVKQHVSATVAKIVLGYHP